MQLQIQAPSPSLSIEIRQFIELRMGYLMASLRHHMRRCRVLINDVRDTLGKQSTQCQLVIALDTKDEIVIEGQHEDLYDAVNAALHKARRIVQKRLKRQ